MERIKINGRTYMIDIEKCKKEGLLIEEKQYPKNWKELTKIVHYSLGWYDVGECHYVSEHKSLDECTSESTAFRALGCLIQLRDWWWDNVCGGWRPDWNNSCSKFCIFKSSNTVQGYTNSNCARILSFPTAETRDKFLETYADLIETAKMFL